MAGDDREQLPVSIDKTEGDKIRPEYSFITWSRQDVEVLFYALAVERRRATSPVQ